MNKFNKVVSALLALLAVITLTPVGTPVSAGGVESTVQRYQTIQTLSNSTNPPFCMGSGPLTNQRWIVTANRTLQLFNQNGASVGSLRAGERVVILSGGHTHNTARIRVESTGRIYWASAVAFSSRTLILDDSLWGINHNRVLWVFNQNGTDTGQRLTAGEFWVSSTGAFSPNGLIRVQRRGSVTGTGFIWISSVAFHSGVLSQRFDW